MKTTLSLTFIILGISVTLVRMHSSESISSSTFTQEEKELQSVDIDFKPSESMNFKSGNRRISSIEDTNKFTSPRDEIFNESSSNDVLENTVNSLSKVYLRTIKDTNSDIELKNMYKDAKDKGVFFSLKNDMITNPEKYNLSPNEIYQIAVEDLQNFPKKLEEPFAFDKIFTEKEKLFFTEKEAQETYLIAAYDLYLTKTTDDTTAIDKMTADLVTDFENKGDSSYASKIVEVKNIFETPVTDLSAISN
jgi:hypothetical protein